MADVRDVIVHTPWGGIGGRMWRYGSYDETVAEGESSSPCGRWVNVVIWENPSRAKRYEISIKVTPTNDYRVPAGTLEKLGFETWTDTAEDGETVVNGAYEGTELPEGFAIEEA